jgi:hypothetical protein
VAKKQAACQPRLACDVGFGIREYMQGGFRGLQKQPPKPTCLTTAIQNTNGPDFATTIEIGT